MTTGILWVALAALTLRTAPVPVSIAHLRTGVTRIETGLRDGYRRSPTFRGLVEQLRVSGAVVYINAGRCRPDAPVSLEGCAALLASTPDVRYVKVVVDVGLGDDRLIALLGHELQHAVEIARPAASRVGDGTREVVPRIEETEAARSCAAAIRNELRTHR